MTLFHHILSFKKSIRLKFYKSIKSTVFNTLNLNILFIKQYIKKK
ncbi:hypothetical protein ACINWCA157_0418 [Acinetobacter radioresistens WC-A-157]|nr:hypothetical protein ACINWCA157_0418 [Acinetobacter radioresistens WC-A-157]